jgi:hypothetical protein
MAKKKKFQIARRLDKLIPVNVEKLFIPDVFKAPKDEETALACMRSYDSGGIDCLCTVIDEYESIVADNKRKSQPPLKQLSDSTAIERFSSGGVLMQYRKEKGLDKLRADLIEGIARAASFEDGIDLVYAHLMSPEHFEKSDLPIADEAGVIAREKEKIVNGKMEEIAIFYPDMTADEVAWLSLTSGKEEDWVFDKPQRMYWPPSLIEIDLDGLVFAEGTIDDKEFDNINSTSPWQIGGLTGIDSQTCSVPFDTNIKQAIKAIILLSLDDSDLYDKLWSEEMLVPITRGDGSLVKIFAGEARDPMLVKEARKEIVRYYNNSYFDCPYADRAIDFVKMIGTLERVPDFVKEKIPFRGYVRVHGTAMNFIDESGKILDTVPIAAHLSHNIAYQFHSRISGLDRKDTILREIFDELSRKINEKNVEEGNQMPSDVLQDQILEEGIFLSNQAYSRIEKVPKSAMYMRGHISDESLVRTVKFSFYELLDIKDLLKDIPKKLKSGAIALIKRTADLASLDEVLLHEMEAGSYCPSSKTITLSLPEKTPISKSEIDVLLKKLYSERDLMYKFKITFSQTLAHEIGESVYSLSAGIADAWNKINSKVAAGITREERAEYFLTSYGTTALNEDFADTFAMYLMFGSQFRQKCVHPVIKEIRIHENAFFN